MNSRQTSRRSRLYAHFILFVYLTFLGGTFYSDLNFGLRVFHQVAVSLLLGAWLVHLLRSGDGVPLTGLELPLLLFMGVRFVSGWAGLNPRMSVELFWRSMTHALAFYWLVWCFRRGALGTLLRALYLTAGVVCLIGLIEFAGWYVGLPFLPVFQEGWLQVAGVGNPFPPVHWRLNFTLTNATSLSAYLALLTPPALAMALTTRGREGRAAWWGWVGVAVVVQFLTRSRGGLLALVVSLPTFALGAALARRSALPALIQRLRQRRAAWAACGLLMISLVGIGALILPAYAGRTSTVRIRIELWRCALAMVSERPLLGIGIGVYGQALRSCLSVHASQYEHFTTAHNVYLHTAAESGLFALAALVWLVAGVLLAVRRRWQKTETPRERLLLAGVGAALLGFGVNCLVDTFPATPLVLPVLFLVAWLIAPVQPCTTAPRRSRSGALCALALILTFAAGLLWADRGQFRFERSLEAVNDGELDIALAEIEEARERDPALGLYEAQRAYYLGLLAQNDPDTYLSAALTAAAEVLALDDTYSLHHANLAILDWEAGNREAAVAGMERAVRTNPPEPNYQLNLGVMYEETGRPDEALRAYATALRQAPRWAGSGFWQATPFRRDNWLDILTLAETSAGNAGSVWLAAGDPERAQASAEHQVAEAPNRAEGYIALGQASLELGQLDQAGAALDKAVALCPECPGAHVARAELFWEMGRLEAASLEARYALFVRPYAAARAHYTLGRIALSQGELQEAKERLLRAVPPEFVSHNWGVVLYNRRALLLPLPQLTKIGGGLEEAEPWLALADLYLAEGSLEEATAIYNLLLERDPFLNDVRRRLEDLST